MRQLYFIRHGQTDWNAARRMQGQRGESDLNETGRVQADVTARLLAGLEIEALYASPLARARQTVEIIQRRVAVEATYDARVKEWDCGDWSGHLHDDLPRRWPAEWAALESDRFNYRGPGCENYPDMIARAAPFLADVLATPARNVAIVSHGMIGRVLIGLAMGITDARMLSWRQPNDVVYRVRLAEIPGSGPELHHFASGIGPIHGFVRTVR